MERIALATSVGKVYDRRQVEPVRFHAGDPKALGGY